ncbi:MAG TPA: putative 2OG-Fe(II) oxygenase [Xanthomonadales bacterium]|nr:putative 2OG-Fe(II) oxygenase [Xanthomonadales bacterium]
MADVNVPLGPAAMQHLRAAAAAFEARDFATAQLAARSALQLAPQSADAYNLMGLIEFQRGEHELARDIFRRTVELNPRYANAWHNLSGVLAELGDEAAAVDAAATALELSRHAPYEAWFNLGVRAHRAGRLTRAGACFERAMGLKPDDPNALNNLAAVRDAEHRPVEARALAERLLALAPGSLIAAHTFAAIWSKATEPADLLRALEQALTVLARDPGHAGAHECAAIVFGKTGDLERALPHARDAVRLAPDNAAIHATLVRLLEQGGELDAAADAARAALAAHPGDAHLHCLAGTVALELGDAAAAEQSLARAHALDPTDQAAIARRALALDAMSRHDEARALLGLDRFLREIRLDVPEGFPDAAAFNRALADDIRRHSRLRFEPVGLAAKGGYLTEDLLADRTPAILGFERSLRAAIEAYIAGLAPDESHPFARAIPREWRLNIWATRVSAQGVIDTHIHEQSWLSGAYYVELPPGLSQGDPHAGWIEFGRPHRGLPAGDASAYVVREPKVGRLLLFPSYVFHRTLPFEGEGERISISFDLAAAR